MAGNPVTSAHTGPVTETAGQQIRKAPKITQAALDAGHEPVVERTGKRFRLVCSCGWKTPINWTRKQVFQAVADHVWQAGHEYLEKGRLENAGDTPTEIPRSVGGRA